MRAVSSPPRVNISKRFSRETRPRLAFQLKAAAGGENLAKASQKAFCEWALLWLDGGLKADWIRLKNRTQPEQIYGEAEKALRSLLGDQGGDRAEGFRKIMEGIQQLMGQGGSDFAKTLFPGAHPFGESPFNDIFAQLKELRQKAARTMGEANSPENRKKRDENVERLAKMGMFLTLDALKEAVSQLFCITAAEDQQIQAKQQAGFSGKGSFAGMLGPLFSGLSSQIKVLHAQRTATLHRLLPLLNPKMGPGASTGQRIESVRGQIKAEFGDVETLRKFLLEALIPRVAVRLNEDKTGPMGFFPGHIAPVTQFFEMSESSEKTMPLPPAIESFVVLVKKASQVIAEKIFNAPDEAMVPHLPEGL